VGEAEMQADQHCIYQYSGQYRLKNADGNGFCAGCSQLAEPELIADGKGNKAQRGLGNNFKAVYLLQRIEAKTGDVQSAEAERTDQQTGYQIGGDRRQVEIAAYLSSIGHEVIAFGLPRDERFLLSATVFEAINQSDAVVLPLPVSRDANTVNTPLTGDVILLNDLLLCRPHLVFGGIISPILRKELENRNIEYYDYYDSEALTVKNAVLTAEAAIAIAVSCTDFSLFGSKSLVLGYGRIGRQLARYLKALG
jgi:hypothetical protein